MVSTPARTIICTRAWILCKQTCCFSFADFFFGKKWLQKRVKGKIAAARRRRRRRRNTLRQSSGEWKKKVSFGLKTAPTPSLNARDWTWKKTASYLVEITRFHLADSWLNFNSELGLLRKGRTLSQIGIGWCERGNVKAGSELSNDQSWTRSEVIDFWPI